MAAPIQLNFKKADRDTKAMVPAWLSPTDAAWPAQGIFLSEMNSKIPSLCSHMLFTEIYSIGIAAESLGVMTQRNRWYFGMWKDYFKGDRFH